MSNFIYRIEPITPTTRGIFRICLIGADLDYSFAMKARGTEMPEEIRNRFVEIGKGIMANFFDKEELFGSSVPYNFARGSWLLHYCTVPGNACDFGLEYNAQHDFLEDFERVRQHNPLEGFPISYTPHNVDTISQASCLLSLWLEWANLTKSMLDPPKNL